MTPETHITPSAHTTTAVVFQGPERLELRRLALNVPTADQVVVDVEWSGISTGTERLLWSGTMPPFPGLGYPLVPGYESVGRVVEAGPGASLKVGERVFVPGANCFGDVKGLFGGAAARLVVPASRVTRVDEALGERAVLLALAATAQHALANGALPELIIGHGVLGRLLARLAVAQGGTPVVWELNPVRAEGATGYQVLTPDADPRRDYKSIYDVSGDSTLVDQLVMRLARGGEIVLAGFYDRINFAFAPAFMKEARLRVAAEWQPADLHTVVELVRSGTLSLDGLITHRRTFDQASDAYRTAFGEPTCLKMLLDWRTAR
ncbi:MAG: chlorophyll synthesis pathway protein BchC [Myxococcales bacterium]|nr:chlorophyll synthesis pathway protein BchC [Myxococcales bacterium]MDP3503434.1 chlorophyll synthesis pathway protein BchC [Myxococcales bacterium]